jgi:murein DD-endopeptidase MepM/ murein hydrolase activator NlpD
MIKKFKVRQVALLAALIFLMTACSQKDGNYAVSSEEGVDSSEQIINIEYGLPADSFNIHKGVIKPNQFLADILLKYHVSYPEIDRLVKKAKETFDVRYMKSGQSYAVFCGKDSIGKAKCFIYEPNAEEFIVFDLRDSINVYKGVKPVEIRENVSYGVINSSLYQTLQDISASPALAMELANIYAWTIDFYRIQKGDNFKVIYTEKYIDNQRIGIHEIKSAVFSHYGNEFYAFAYEQDGFKDYFDMEANSLRKAFLQSPLKFGRLTSSYTLKRFHPVQKRWKAHKGTDYAAPHGTPIMSTSDGVVIEARYKKYNGKRRIDNEKKCVYTRIDK